MFTVLDPLLEFTYHLLSSWRKFALFIQSLLCMLFLFGWPPCQRSDMILMEVSQRAYDMIHYISGLYGYLYVCEIYVNLIWYLYLFMLNKFCLSLSESDYPLTAKRILRLGCFHSYFRQCLRLNRSQEIKRICFLIMRAWVSRGFIRSISHILQGYFTGIGTIIQLPQYQWRVVEG